MKIHNIVYIACVAGLISCGSPTGGGGGGGDNTTVKYNEGTIANPIVLSLDTPHQVKLGKLSAGETKSYYKITTDTAGTYDFTASSFAPTPTVYGMNAVLHTDAQYSDISMNTVYYAASMTTSALAAATTYYLELGNIDSNYNVTYNLTVSRTP